MQARWLGDAVSYRLSDAALQDLSCDRLQLCVVVFRDQLELSGALGIAGRRCCEALISEAITERFLALSRIHQVFGLALKLHPIACMAIGC